MVFFPYMPELPSHHFPLESMPRLVQAGLSLHGVKASESFRQDGLWSLHAYHYEGALKIDGTTYRFLPGWISLIPPDIEVEWQFPQHAPHYYAHFRTGSARRSPTRIPLLRNLGDQGESFGALFENMTRLASAHPRHANVRLWDLLHQMAEDSATLHAESHLHPSLQIALSLIRNTPSEKLLIGDMARRMGVSHNHLTLLFQKQLGCGAREYIRSERIKRARELLTHSRLQIKSIAIECGFPDLAYFNKVIRASTGRSPTELRKLAFSGTKVVPSRRRSRISR